VLAEVLHFVGVDASDAATLVATVAAEREGTVPAVS
jgi:hypothetical protein